MPKPATNTMKTMKTMAKTKPMKTMPMKGQKATTAMKTMAKTKPMNAMPMKGQKNMKAMKAMKAKPMKTQPKKGDQPMDVPWNGKIHCASHGCKSWIYVRKSQWYAKCTHCKRPWMSSLQVNGIQMPDTQFSPHTFLPPKPFLLYVWQKFKPKSST